MLNEPGIVSLLVDGMLYEGWLEVEITRSVKEMAGKFTLKVSEVPVDGVSSLVAWRIKEGDACVVLYDGEPVVTGYVDVYNPRFDATTHEVTVSGRSKTADMVDSSAETDVEGGELNKVTLDQLARKLAAKHGIAVKVEADANEVIDTVRVHLGETKHELLERYARPGAVALTDSAAGELRLLQVDGGGIEDHLVEGGNILKGAAFFRADNRHSDYTVKGQDKGTDGEHGKAVAQRGATVKDKAVKRYRPFALLNETKTTRDGAKKRAGWEAAARAGESTRAEVSLVGWRTTGGRLWMPGFQVSVTSPMLRLAGKVLAVETVRYQQKESTTVSLSMVPPEALNPKAKGKSGGGKGGAGGDQSDPSWEGTKPTEDPYPIGPDR